MVENEKGLKNEKFITKNDNEYEDIIFKTFFYECKIKMERSMRDMPQQNGLVECMNHILTKRSISRLK